MFINIKHKFVLISKNHMSNTWNRLYLNNLMSTEDMGIFRSQSTYLLKFNNPIDLMNLSSVHLVIKLNKCLCVCNQLTIRSKPFWICYGHDYNSLPINLLFHNFLLLLGQLIGFLLLSIYGSGKAVCQCLIPLNIIHISLPIWQCLKYSCHLSSNIKQTGVARYKKMIPILGFCLAWHSYFQSLFYCYIFYVNASQILPVLESSHVANIILF